MKELHKGEYTLTVDEIIKKFGIKGDVIAFGFNNRIKNKKITQRVITVRTQKVVK